MSIQKRPILFLLIPFIFGIYLADKTALSIPFFIIGLLICILTFIIFFWMKSTPYLAFLILLLNIFLVGWIRIQFQKDVFNKQTIHQFIKKPLHVKLFGELNSQPELTRNGKRTVVSLDSLAIQNKIFLVHGNVLVSWKHQQSNLNRGDYITTSGTITQADSERNPGEFNYRSYLERRNIAGLFYVGKKDTIQVVEKSKGFVPQKLLFDQPRKYISKVFETYIYPLDNTSLLKGLILGLRGEINPGIRSDFADTGVVHVLAVSGLHVGFVALFLLGICKLLRLPFLFRMLFLMFGLIYYAGLTGFKPPVVRAVLMADLYILGNLIQRKADVYNILAAAALIILMIKPQSLFDVGFQLSFVAVFSIVFFYSKFRSILFPENFLTGKNYYKIARWPLELALVSVCAQIGTLPLTAIYFERVSILATLVNPPAIFLVMIIVFLGFILIPVSLVWSFLAELLGHLISFLLTCLITLIHWFSSIPFVKFEIAHISTFSIFLIFVLSLIVFYNLFKRRFKVVVMLLLLFVNVWLWISIFEKDELRLTYFDVGQGDACLVELPRDKSILIDTGPNTQNYDAGTRTIIPYLKRRNMKKLDAIFISHSHNDHSGGLVSLIQQFPVNHVYTSNGSQDKPEEDFVTICDSLNVPIDYLAAGNTVDDFHPAKIQILSPFQFMLKEGLDFNENENSLVIRLVYGEHCFLFCGDIEKQTEEYLLSYDSLLQSQVLKSPHHGSSTSNTLPFLRQVDPDWAVISVGKWNRFSHPSRTVLNRFQDENIQFVRTDENGAVVFVSNGEKLQRIR